MKTRTSGIFGYIVQDKAGVVSIFPDHTNNDVEVAMRAENYVRDNKLLEKVEKMRNEDEIEFRIRLSSLAEDWRKKLKSMSCN